MRRSLIVVAALFGTGCGSATLTLEAGSEPDQLGQLHHELGARLEATFGPGARVQRAFGLGDAVVLGIALEAEQDESDVRQPLALARYEATTDSLTVVAAQADFKEGLVLSGATALVTAAGELKLRGADGTERILASDVKGEVAPAPRGLLFTLEGTAHEGGDSAVVLTDFDGRVTTLADGDGVDDRPSISPDAVTVVFVSGRTGVATREGGAR